MTPQELKNSILQLAIQGKLVEQRADEGTGAELLEKILAAKNAKDAKGKGEKSHAKSAKSAKVGSCVSREEIPDDEKPFDIPESWEWVRLESIVNSVPSKQYQILESEVRTSGKFAVISQSKEYSIGFTDISEKVYHHVNPVIVFGDHTTEVKYVEFDFVVGADGVKIFEPLDGLLLAKYLLYVLLFNTYDLSKVGGYSRHYKFLKNKPIPLPPLAEQKRIVAKIEELMPLVDRYEKAWSRLEDFNKRFPADMQKSLLQLAIQGKLVEQRPEEGTGEELYRRLKSYHSGLKPCKDELDYSSMNFTIPANWTMIELNQLFDFVDYRGKTPNKTTSGVFLITASNIRQAYMDYTRKEYISREEYKGRQSRGLTQKGDLLFTTEAPMGNAALCDLDECSCGQRIITFKEYAKGTAYPALYMYFLLSPQFQQQLLDNCTGTTAKGIKADKLKHFLIPLPPLAEQKRIVAKLEELLPLCERLKSASNSAVNP